MNNLSFDSSKLKQPPIIKWIKVEDGSEGPTPRPRHGHRGVALKEFMIVFGGGNEGIVDELHVYDVSKNKWFMPVVRGDIPRGFAAYGIVTDQSKVFIFGGMIEYGRYSNDMYELQTNRWEWRRLRVRPQNGNPGPCARLGHTFTLGCDHYAYVFGGLANDSNDSKINLPRYLNDLYAVNLANSQGVLWWEIPMTSGPCPAPRESHTAVHFVTQSGKEQLIIYGGMDGRRMNDVWILDMIHWTWSNPVPNGIEPLPRSLHTANIIGNRMFVFGGWVPLQPNEKAEQPDKEWKCTDSLAVLNLSTLSWEQPIELATGGAQQQEQGVFVSQRPGARAGHCSVILNRRIYIWSGRDGYKKTWNSQVCCSDMWYLEVEPAATPAGIQLIRASINSLEIQWTTVPNADHYLLQVQKVEPAPQMDAEHRAGKRIPRGMPPSQSVRMFRPAVYRQPRPAVMMVQHPTSGAPLTSSYPPTTTMRQQDVTSTQQRTIILHKANQSAVVATEHMAVQQKLLILQPKQPTIDHQSGAAPIEAQFVKPPQTTRYELHPSQVDRTGYTTSGTTTKTTYAAPVAPAIDQTMPTNILDEALNEAESFVDEQLQLQQKQQQQQEAAAQQLPQQQEQQKASDEQQMPTENLESAAEQTDATATMENKSEMANELEAALAEKPEKSKDAEAATPLVDEVKEELEKIPKQPDPELEDVEKMRASSHDEKEDLKELEPTQQSEVQEQNHIPEEEQPMEQKQQPPAAEAEMEKEDQKAHQPQQQQQDEEKEETPSARPQGGVELEQAAIGTAAVADSTPSAAMELPPTTTQQMTEKDSYLDPSVATTGPSDQEEQPPNLTRTNITNGTGNGTTQIGQQQQSQHSSLPPPQQADHADHGGPTARYYHPPMGMEQSEVDQWYDAATLTESKCLVTHYLVPVSATEQEQIAREQSLPESASAEYRKLVNLEPGIAYKFRVCAVNSVGQSRWSPVNSFKTCMPGYPGAPSSIKITKGVDGAHISWEAPQTTNGHIIEYSVYLAMRSASVASPAFVPVYIGPAPNCVVNHQNLQLAHIDANPKPAIIFRIAARNEKGYGPATQVRWLQDQRPMAVMPPLPAGPGGRPPQYQRASPIATGPMMAPSGAVGPAGMKRTYQYQQQQMPNFHQQQQQPMGDMMPSAGSSPGPNRGRIVSYGAPTSSALPTRVMHASTSATPSPASTPTMAPAMAHPHGGGQQQQQVQQRQFNMVQSSAAASASSAGGTADGAYMISSAPSSAAGSPAHMVLHHQVPPPLQIRQQQQQQHGGGGGGMLGSGGHHQPRQQQHQLHPAGTGTNVGMPMPSQQQQLHQRQAMGGVGGGGGGSGIRGGDGTNNNSSNGGGGTAVGLPPGINPAMNISVREYLTGGNKRLRLEQ